MSTSKHIKQFSATDIERYHKGQLSPKERHDLERAALDDPFLADALEGYTNASVSMQADLDQLRSQLGTRIQSTPLVEMKERKRSSFTWLRIAALLILIAGAAFLANEFVFKKKDNGIVRNNQDLPNTTDTSVSSSNNTAAITGTSSNTVSPAPTTQQPTTTTEGPSLNNSTTRTEKIKNIAPVVAKTTAPGTQSNPNTERGITIYEDNKDEEKSKEIIASATEKRKDDITDKTKPVEKDGDGVNDKVDKAVTDIKKTDEAVAGAVRSNAEMRSPNEQEYYRRQNQPITFRGRVTDANNVGVPFANVTNAQDNNAGTYTDAQGNFVLTYPDSVLSVQVRSIGFESRSVDLRNNVPNNQVVLQDDRQGLSEVVLSKQRPNAVARNNRNSNVKLQEPEPADGWENYDAYLANNLNAPEEIRNKPSSGGTVELSFEVNKYGEPVDIKIEKKSPCDKCNDEAIRLIKAGPKWKPNANRKARTTVTINF